MILACFYFYFCCCFEFEKYHHPHQFYSFWMVRIDMYDRSSQFLLCFLSFLSQPSNRYLEHWLLWSCDFIVLPMILTELSSFWVSLMIGFALLVGVENDVQKTHLKDWICYICCLLLLSYLAELWYSEPFPSDFIYFARGLLKVDDLIVDHLQFFC
jgi:hypothetical protein